ncbi:MAG: peptidylprolyl isomerase [Xanthobacteraceae bacterium]|jgi:peptidyl-prolyl cis-trans isomerase C|uniref:peptidylprolyl isomerase n=1 Tax=Pseudolabrys sp. TaxID=1960880 RepID=UPI003D0E99A4
MLTPNKTGPALAMRAAGAITATLTATLALALTLASINALPVRAQTPDPVIAKVNGVDIHESDVKAAEEEAGQIPQMTPDAKREYLISFLTDMVLVTQAAEAKKIADTPDFKKRMEFARNKLLMSKLFDVTGKEALTDAAMQKVYDDAVKQLPEEQEVHARHILIRADAKDDKASKAAEDKIKAIIVRLNKGEDFAKLAGELTEDPSGKANGGDLGFFTKEQMVPEFATAAFEIAPGKISDPIKTQFGWHVLKVEEKRKKPAPAFDEVKAQIETYVVRKAQADLVTKLRADAKIERLDKKDEPAKDDKKADEPAKK